MRKPKFAVGDYVSSDTEIRTKPWYSLEKRKIIGKVVSIYKNDEGNIILAINCPFYGKEKEFFWSEKGLTRENETPKFWHKEKVKWAEKKGIVEYLYKTDGYYYDLKSDDNIRISLLQPHVQLCLLRQQTLLRRSSYAR